MKKYALLASFTLFLTVLIFSCGKTGRGTVSAVVVFDTIKVDETFLKPAVTWEGNVATDRLTISFIYPVDYPDTASLSKMQSIFIEKVFGEDFATMTPQAAVDSFVRLQRMYFDENEIYEEDHFEWQYYTDIKDTILFQGNGLISFLKKEGAYGGGAHDLQGIYGYVYNTATGSFLTEDDFAGKNYSTNISELITAKIKATNEIPEGKGLADIGYDSNIIAPNENFTVDDKGITYYFNEYEIGGGFLGITTVFIPYNELKVYIAKNNPVAALADK
jgi:hypothetical protein